MPPPLSMYEGNTLPSWQATLKVNGAFPNFSSGWTFQVTISESRDGAILKTKTTGITGAADGEITVAWAADDAGALDAGTYFALLTATSTAGNESVGEVLNISPRPS